MSFILHLHVVLLMDGNENMKVPHLVPCYRTVTAHLLGSLVLLLIGVGGCGWQIHTSPQVKLEFVAGGFTSPVALVDPEDRDRHLFVVEQTGLIWILSEGQRLELPFLDLRERVVELNAFYDERGLLGLAFHPDFAANGRFYVSYSAPLQGGVWPAEWDHTTYVSEFTVSNDDPNQADPDSERVLLAIDKPGYNYEAGHIAFGPEGHLYIATGDSVRDPATGAGRYAQDTSSLLGKILRIDVNGMEDTGRPYLIPTDNPFASGGGLPEIFAYGFRNPYRFSFDLSIPGEPRLFVADVGQALMEEVSLVEAGSNYGWPIREGTVCFNTQMWNQPLKNCPASGLSEPVIAYAHRGDLSAIIGGAVYHGQAISGLAGKYIFGDWGRGRGHLFFASPPRFGLGLWEITEIALETEIGQLLGIGQDEHGELYLLTKAPGLGASGYTGAVYKIVTRSQ